MASATATATMAAAGFDKRASSSTSSSSSSLQTPGSGTFPSELRSPLATSPSFLKRDDALKTPITPPSAYLDFLKNMSPAVMSPMSTSTSSRFNFNEKSVERTSEPATEKPSISPPTSQPALSRNTSYDSNASTTTTTSSDSAASYSSASTSTRTKPESPRITIPPSPFAKPGPRSARTPRRLQIPQSPFSPAAGSARTVPSPYTSTPLSAAPWSASFSPRDVDPEINGKPGKVSVRQVVTRTVTYCRTPLEPAPRGKRRKLEAPAESAMGGPPVAPATDDKPALERLSEEPVVKQEAPADNIDPALMSPPKEKA